MQQGGFPFKLDRPVKRGPVLSVLLVLFMVFCLFGAVNIVITLLAWKQIAGQIAAEHGSVPDTFSRPLFLLSMLAYLLGGSGAFGLWKWRRWGLYLMIAGAITSLGIELAVHEPISYSPVHVSVLVIVVALIWGKWRYLE